MSVHLTCGHFACVDLPNADRGTVFHVVVPR